MPRKIPIDQRDVYYLSEVARKLGMGVSALHKPGALERLYAAGMPRPVAGTGWLRFSKERFDAWFNGRPLPAPAANDPRSIAEWKAFLQQHYGNG